MMQKEIKGIFESQQKMAGDLRQEPVSSRKAKLKKLEQLILQYRYEICKALSIDMGKPQEEVEITELYPLLSEIRMTRKHLASWTRPKKIKTSLAYLGTSARVHYEPLGVSLIISPWNFPVLLALGPAVSAIAAGNTFMIKPSEFTPQTNNILERLLSEIFGESEVCMVQGDAETAKSLLALPFDHIFFTGSPAVGREVMKAAAANLTPVTLELGGKSPCIIDQSADVTDVARKIAWGKWTNAGQTCIAPDYLLIHSSIQTAFLRQLQRQVEVYHDKGHYTSIVNKSHFDRLKSLLENAIGAGAHIVFGGELDEKALTISPTVLVDVDHTSRIMEEEIFGPILPILIYDDLAQAIDYINARPKPLSLYTYTKSAEVKRKIIATTSSGGVVVNDNVIQFGHPYLPMGGVGQSGMGKAHGHEGFLKFSHPKSVLKQKTGITIPQFFYPPYTNLKKRLIELMLKYF